MHICWIWRWMSCLEWAGTCATSSRTWALHLSGMSGAPAKMCCRESWAARQVLPPRLCCCPALAPQLLPAMTAIINVALLLPETAICDRLRTQSKLSASPCLQLPADKHKHKHPDSRLPCIPSMLQHCSDHQHGLHSVAQLVQYVCCGRM